MIISSSDFHNMIKEIPLIDVSSAYLGLEVDVGSGQLRYIVCSQKDRHSEVVRTIKPSLSEAIEEFNRIESKERRL